MLCVLLGVEVCGCLGSERGRARIERDLLGEQALELLVSIAKGESLLPAAEIAEESGAAALVAARPVLGKLRGTSALQEKIQ